MPVLLPNSARAPRHARIACAEGIFDVFSPALRSTSLGQSRNPTRQRHAGVGFRTEDTGREAYPRTWGHRLGLVKGEFCRRMFRPLTRSKKQKLSMHSLPANVSRLQSTARK